MGALKLYISDHNRVLADLKNHPDVEETELFSADAAVVWQDYRGIDRDVVMFCNSVGIPTLVMQHGGNQTKEYLPPTDDVPEQFPLFASLAMVWGPEDRDRLLGVGYGPERVILTGAAAFDHIPKREKREGINVVYFPVKWEAELEENYALLRALLEPGKYNVITKIVREYHNEARFRSMHEKYGGEVVATSCDAPGHFEALYELMRAADLFVVNWNAGTPSLLADCMDIPIVYADILKPRPVLGSEEDCHFIAPDDGDTVSDLSNLVEVMDYNLAHPEHRREHRRETARRLANFGAEGKALDRIVAAIRDAIESTPENPVKSRHYSRLGPADAAALSESIIEVLKDKAERGFRSYAEALRSENAYIVLEAVMGFSEDYVLAEIPAGTDYGTLPFSAENTVSAHIGKKSTHVSLKDMRARVADGSVDVVFDMNYPRGLPELVAKAEEYARALKAGGELRMFLPNPGALKSRVKVALGMEAPRFYSKEFPTLRKIDEGMARAGLKRVSAEAVHPRRLYIRTESAAARKKLKIAGALYRLFRGLLPGGLASVFILVYKKEGA